MKFLPLLPLAYQSNQTTLHVFVFYRFTFTDAVRDVEVDELSR